MMREIAAQAGNFRGVCPLIGRLRGLCTGVYRRRMDKTGLFQAPVFFMLRNDTHDTVDKKSLTSQTRNAEPQSGESSGKKKLQTRPRVAQA